MNKFDDRYDIRIANYNDIESIMNFIDLYWRKDHILANDRAYFEYEFLYENQVNFVIAIDKNKNEIEGLLGFIYTSNPKTTIQVDIWGSVWKVKDGNMPFLGVEIAKRMEEMLNCRVEIGLGVNPKTAAPLRKRFFKDTIKKMNHYYKLNPIIQDFKIAKIAERNDSKYNVDKAITSIKIENMEMLESLFSEDVLKSSIPYKDFWYINKRFFKHPYYRYHVYALKYINKDVYEALIIMRECEITNNKVIRIVDYYGNKELFQYSHLFFGKILVENNYEYIDFYVLGFKEEYIIGAGFNGREDNNIIPNYFEPFVKTNVDIWVNYPQWCTNVQIYKADADQDRPNNLRKRY